MKKYLAYDDYNRKLYDDPTIGGAIRPHIAVPYCAWKVLEIDTDKIKMVKQMKIIKIRQATSKGFVEMPMGGYSMHHNPRSKTRRGRCQGDPPGSICPTLMAHNSDSLLRIEGDKKMTKEEMIQCLAIRKLTPTEAFRLQGMRDEDVEKCRAVGISNSSLYKIAGNGLVSNCVQYIMEHLYKVVVDSNYQTTDEKAVADGYGV